VSYVSVKRRLLSCMSVSGSFSLITKMLLYLQHRMRVFRFIWVKQRTYIIYWKQNERTKLHSNITYYTACVLADG